MYISKTNTVNEIESLMSRHFYCGKNGYAKVKIYIEKSSGKLMYMKLDFKKLLIDEQNSRHSEPSYTWLNTMFQKPQGSKEEYSYKVEDVVSYFIIQINPKKYTKIKMPKNYVDKES